MADWVWVRQATLIAFKVVALFSAQDIQALSILRIGGSILAALSSKSLVASFWFATWRPASPCKTVGTLGTSIYFPFWFGYLAPLLGDFDLFLRSNFRLSVLTFGPNTWFPFTPKSVDRRSLSFLVAKTSNLLRSSMSCLWTSYSII